MTINWNSRTGKDNVSILLQLKLKYTPEEFGYRGSRGCFNSNLETVFVRLFLNTHAKVIKTNNEGKETNADTLTLAMRTRLLTLVGVLPVILQHNT